MHNNDYDTFLRISTNRWSCRAFRPDPVPRALVEKILRAAQTTASWANLQPWQVTVTTGNSTLRLRKAMKAQAEANEPYRPDFPYPREYKDVWLQRRRSCGLQLYAAMGIARGDRESSKRQMLRNYDLFDAPHAAVVTTDESIGVYGAVACGAYVNNFMLAAQALGVATIAEASIADYSDTVRDCLGLPDTSRVVCGISFGWADAAHPVNQFRTARADLSEVVEWADWEESTLTATSL